MWVFGQEPSPLPQPSKPSYDAFSIEGDPPGLSLCRPCRDNAKLGPFHGCDGPPCACLMCCSDLAEAVSEMETDWNFRTREAAWRDQR